MYIGEQIGAAPYIGGKPTYDRFTWVYTARQLLRQLFHGIVI